MEQLLSWKQLNVIHGNYFHSKHVIVRTVLMRKVSSNRDAHVLKVFVNCNIKFSNVSHCIIIISTCIKIKVVQCKDINKLWLHMILIFHLC